MNLNNLLRYHVTGSIERGNAEPIYECITEYERRCRELESEGMTRSDAQAVADAELNKKVKK